MKKSIFSLVLFFLFSIGEAQIDNLFYFAAPDISLGHQQSPIHLCLASFGNPVTVTITQPANINFQPITIHLNAYSYQSYDLSARIAMVENQPANTVLDYGIKVTATDKIIAYYEVEGANSEIYTLKGRNALGTHFLIPMQYGLENYLNFTPTPYNSIEIVATQNNTTITIVPSVNLLGGGQAGTPITIVLDEGQTYTIRSASNTPLGHLCNTTVTSNKPIAVSVTDDSVSSGNGQDLVGDQIVPEEFAGNTYIAIWNNNAYEAVYIFPLENNTHIYINGATTPVTTLNYGQKYAHTLNTESTLITSDKPIFVFQLTGAGGEPGGTILPQLDCTGSTDVIYARPSYSTNLIATFVVQTAYINNFTINNSTTLLTANDFVTLPYDPTWSYCKKNLTSFLPTQTVMVIQNSAGPFHVGMVDYYTAMSCSLGYFSGYQNSGNLFFNLREHYCQQDSICFNYISDGIENIRMVNPAGDTLWQQPFVIDTAMPIHSGRYYILGDDATGCREEPIMDSIDINVVATYKPDLGEDQYHCNGDLVLLESNYAVPNTSYYWSDGSTTSDIYVIAEGQYILNVSSISGDSAISCEATDTINFFFRSLPKVDFTADVVEGCAPLMITFNNLSTTDTAQLFYQWKIYNEEGVLTFTSEAENPHFEFFAPGTYDVSLLVYTQYGCTDSLIKSAFLHIYAQPFAEFTPNPEISFMADNDGAVSFINYADSSLLLNSNLSFTWDFGDGNTNSEDFAPTHTYQSWGDYVVTLFIETQGGCKDQISHFVILEEELIFPNVITPNGDGINDVFAIENLNILINPEDPDNYRTNHLTVYNRWGKKVYEVDNYDTYIKDGEIFVGQHYFDAATLEDGVYYFVFYYKGKLKTTDYSASLTVIRNR